MKKILMIATGGTIASKETENGLTPAMTGEELAASVPGIKDKCVRGTDAVVRYGGDEFAAIRRQIASGIDVIVHLGRLRDKSRKLLEVSEVMDYREGEIHLQTVYRYEETGEENGKIQGVWEKKGELKHTGKLLAAGYNSIGKMCNGK